MYLRSPNKDYAKLKLELPITRAPKYGKAKNMEINAIFGHLESYYMKCVL